VPADHAYLLSYCRELGLPLRAVAATSPAGDAGEAKAGMLAPAGGMDRIPLAFAKALRNRPILGVEVVELRQDFGRAEVVYRERKTGALKALYSDFAVVAIPMPVLAGVRADFTPDVRRAIAAASATHANKVAFEAPRFWEEDRRTAAKRGLLVAAYNVGAPAVAFERLPLEEQIELARAAVGRAHPGREGDLANPMVVNWSKEPFSLGASVEWADPAAREALGEAEGRFLFAGADLSPLPGWLEGGVLSARRAVGQIARRSGGRTLIDIDDLAYG